LGRVLICVISSGFNDALNQIWKCWNYGKKYYRRVEVFVPAPGVIKEAFELLESLEPEFLRFVTNATDLVQLDNKSCFPRVLEGKISSGLGDYVESDFGPIDAVMGLPITFDFDSDYPEEVLVHHSWGGGFSGVELLNFLRLREHVAHQVKLDSGISGTKYSMLHIRSTDYESAFQFISKKFVRKARYRNLFVSSDNSEVLHYMRSLVPGQRLFHSPVGYGRFGDPSHSARKSLNRGQQKAEALRIFQDLWAAANASEYFFGLVTGNRGNPTVPTVSGFSYLLGHVYKNPTLSAPFFRQSSLASIRRKRRPRPIAKPPELYSFYLLKIRESIDKLQRGLIRAVIRPDPCEQS
jgi:hypothetical protein